MTLTAAPKPDAPLPAPLSADGTYHVFVFDTAKPKGGLRDLVASKITLNDARMAVDEASGVGRQYHIVTVHPETFGLVVVESGTFTARKPSKIDFDPWQTKRPTLKAKATN